MITYGVGCFVHDCPTLTRVVDWLDSSQGKIPVAWVLYWSAMAVVFFLSLIFQVHTSRAATDIKRSSNDEYAAIA